MLQHLRRNPLCQKRFGAVSKARESTWPWRQTECLVLFCCSIPRPHTMGWVERTHNMRFVQDSGTVQEMSAPRRVNLITIGGFEATLLSETCCQTGRASARTEQPAHWGTSRRGWWSREQYVVCYGLCCLLWLMLFLSYCSITIGYCWFNYLFYCFFHGHCIVAITGIAASIASAVSGHSSSHDAMTTEAVRQSGSQAVRPQGY